MKLLFSKHFWLYAVLFFVGFTISWSYAFLGTSRAEQLIESAVVAQGDIIEEITASGKTEAKDIARLNFAASGIIRQIHVSVGSRVEVGEVIASLVSDAATAEYGAALEQVRHLEEQRRELVKGSRNEERVIAGTQVEVAESALQKVIHEYDQAIKNARQSLLSSDLEAYPVDVINDDTPPTISGSYLCDFEGVYELNLYRSTAPSTVSYRLSGLSEGTFSGNVMTPEQLGDCGLYIKFDEFETYRSKTWLVSIPNTRSNNYVTLRNSYELLLAEREAAIQVATKELALVRDQEKLVQSSATKESLAQIDALIAAAKARLAVQSALIADYTVRAPFAGLISDINMKVGESVNVTKTVTIVAENAYEFKAQIPESEVTKVAVGNTVKIEFDAYKNTLFSGEVVFISPVSINMGGVSYYNAHIVLNDPPVWMREGLNADVFIEVASKKDVLVLPKRYLVTDESGTWVYIKQQADQNKRVKVEVGSKEGGGMVEVLNIPLGTVVELPV